MERGCDGLWTRTAPASSASHAPSAKSGWDGGLLLAAICPGLPVPGSLRTLIEETEGDNDTRWVDWERYSNKQGTKITMGGFVGTAIYKGDLAGFMPWLYWANTCIFEKGAQAWQVRACVSLREVYDTFVVEKVLALRRRR